MTPARIPFRLARGARGSFKRAIYSVAVTLCLLATPSLLAQTIRSIEHTERDGLPSAQVHDIDQLDDGRILLATRSGLVTYDGRSWIVDSDWTTKLLAPSRIARSTRGALAVGSQLSTQPLAIRAGDAWRYIDPPPYRLPREEALTRSRQLLDYVQHQDGEVLLMGGSREVFALDAEGWRPIASFDQLGASIHDVESFDGAFVIATTDGLATRRGGELGYEHEDLLSAAGRGGANVQALALDGDRLWIVADSWLGRFSSGEFELIIDDPERLEPGATQTLQPDGVGGALIGGFNNLLHYDSSARRLQSVHGQGKPISTPGATAIFRDRERVFWIATERGVRRIPSLRFNNYSRRDGLYDDEVTAILESPPGRMVLAHADGLSFLEDGKTTRLPLPLGGNHLRKIISMVADAQGNLWVTRDRGGVQRIATDLSVRHFASPEESVATSLFIDDEEQLWLTHSRGLARLDGDRFVSTDAPPKIRVRRGVQLSNGDLCQLTAGHGMYVGSPGDWRHLGAPTSRPFANNVYHALVDAQGRLLVATEGGVQQAIGGVLEPWQPSTPELNESVFSIAQDEDDVLWFGTQNGIVRWDGQRALRYSVAQGLAGYETNRSALHFDSKGRLWTGTVGGASCYRSEHDILEYPPPQLSLHEILVGAEPHSASLDLDLAAADNDLEFSFHAVSFIDDGRVQYRCRLGGYDEGWLEGPRLLDSGRVRYTNLPPGEYRFHVSASNSRGQISELVSSSLIVIRTPYWRRWWFLALVALTFGTLAWGGNRLLFERKRSADLGGQVRKRTAELHATERNYREVFEQSRAPQLLIDSESGVITAANDAAHDLYGHPRGELVGSTYDLLVDEEQRRSPEPSLLEVDPSSGERFDQVHRTALGDERHVEVFTSVHELDGKRTVQVLIHDVTRRKRLEEQLSAAQRMESIGMLAGGIAHDFNNLLTTILGNAELVLHELENGSVHGSLVQEGLDAILDSGERAAGLTRQLLTFSRRQVVRFQVTDFNQLIRDMESMLRRLTREDVTLELELESGIACIMAEPSQLEQVVMNLVVNASDAMPMGGHLSIETADVVLDEDYARHHIEVTPGDYVMLAVSDTGVGMSKATRSRVFEPFFTTKAPHQGTGLGLATIHGIIKQAGGHVNVYSEEGRGTTFKVYLPKTESEQSAPEATEHPTSDLDGSETILICEDDPALRKLTTRIFENHGYEVFAAELPSVALEWAKDAGRPIDMLVTDVIMPEMNGRELAEAITRQRADLRVLYVSGYTANVIALHGVLKPGVELLQKPFTAQSLLRRVRGLLDGELEPKSPA